MKKIFTFLLLFAGIIGAYADNTLTVSEALVPAGKSGSFNIELNNTDKFKGFTMFMTLPEGVTLESVVSNSARLGATQEPTKSGNKYGIGYISTTDIAGNSGVLLTINVKADASLAAGSKLDAKITDATFGKSDGSGDVVIPDVNFQIEITDKVVIDETSAVLPAAQTDVDVLVKRTIKNGVWTAICLPFDMTYDQVKEIFGDDVKFADFTDFANEGTNFVVNFSSSDIAADKFYGNWPYIVKTSKDITEFTVKAVDVDPKEDEAVAEYETGSGKKKTVVGTFTGTLKAGTIVPENNLILVDGELQPSNGTTTINGMQGYLWLNEYTSASTVQLKVDGELPTAIEGLNIVTEDGSYYNMSGMKVENPTQKGVYIRNGKKVVIK